MSRTGWKKAATLLAVLTPQERERILGELDAVTADRLRRETDRLGSVPVPVARAIRTEFLDALKAPAPEILDNACFAETENPGGSVLPPELTDEENLIPPLDLDGTRKGRIDAGPHALAGPHFSPSSMTAPTNKSGNEADKESDPEEWIGPDAAYPSADFLYAQMAGERPQTCAACIARLPKSTARAVLQQFDEPKRTNIEQRLARMGSIEPEIWEQVERILDAVPGQCSGAETAETE